MTITSRLTPAVVMPELERASLDGSNVPLKLEFILISVHSLTFLRREDPVTLESILDMFIT
ncbi:ORF931 [White spot syndrome virus]|uniref:ORF931 n=1 Tax=White spot syndrome virus TaxID=342409 RepID=A0A2D3I762_9VIRU|nr:ORF931 [White spot syndrome virus]